MTARNGHRVDIHRSYVLDAETDRIIKKLAKREGRSASNALRRLVKAGAKAKKGGA